MNRLEFGALISSTMAPPQHSSTGVRAHHPAPYPRPHLPQRSPHRQQSHTSGGSHGSTRKIRSEADVEPLRTVATRSVRPQPLSHGRSHLYVPQAKSSEIVALPAEHGVLPRRPRKSMVAEIEEPDFGRDEREAWGKKSPKTEIDLVTSQSPSYGRANRASHQQASYHNPDIILHPPRIEKDLPPQPRKQSKQTLPLREFAPLLQKRDTEERPKTSRGSGSFNEDDRSLRSSEDSQASAMTEQKMRRSRFLEGSLNDRSAGVASSWYDQASEDSYDSDITPRASRDTFESGSMKSIDTKPLPMTPATAKRKTLFKLRNKLSDEVEPAAEQHEVYKKKGLRKSISTWNFNLGDKMKIFGGSTSDLTPKAPKLSKDQQKFSKTPSKDSVKDVLDERKRKAEEAYSQQFTLKKQKSNAGIANPTDPAEACVPSKPSSLKRRTPSSSSRTSSASYRNRVSSSTISRSLTPDQSASDADNGKRPSRKELEKENQALRKMLRQSSSTQYDACRSSVHLPLDNAPVSENPPRLSQEIFAQGHKMRISPGKGMGRRGEDVPPVPKLSREVLGSLENGWQLPANVSEKGMLPRPVSMILEEEECYDGNDNDTTKPHTQIQMQMSPVREQWEWPDDVF